MRIVTFEKDGFQRVGVEVLSSGEKWIVDICQVDRSIPGDVIDFMTGGEAMIERAQRAVNQSGKNSRFRPNEVRILAPIPRPGKILCVGLNYRDHALEGGRPIPKYPTIFSKYASCVIGPGEAIRMPRVTSQVDFEAELAVVIGKRCRYVGEADALKYVAGYTCLNDVSGRDYQNRTSQWTIGKIFDTFAPMGPVMVTTDELDDPGELEVRSVLNGVEMQHSNTRELIFTVPFLIEYLSAVTTLEPGDMISTGTPAGVGVFRTPQVFMKAGDVIRVEVERIGVLENCVKDEE